MVKFTLNTLVISQAIFLSLSSVSAQGIKTIGPPGGRIRALAIDPSNSSIVYAGTFEGTLFVSLNGKYGQEISPVPTSSFIRSIVVSPKNSSTLFAGGYRSSDQGMSWAPSTGPAGNYVFNPLDASQLYGTRFSNEIWISRDSGATGSILKKFESSVGEIAISKDDTSNIYALADGAVYKTTNSGSTWGNVTAPLGTISPLSISVHPSNKNLVAIGTRDEGVFHSTDGGQSWQLSLAAYWVQDIIIIDNTLMYAVSGDYLTDYSGAFYRSTDGGKSWQSLNQGLPRPQDRYLYAIAVDPGNSEHLYVGTYGWGVYESTTGGNDWQWSKVSCTEALDIYFDPDDPSRIYAGTPDQGILKTMDSGENWQPLNFPVSKTVQTFFRQFRISPSDNVTAFATGGPYGLFKSPDRGTTWEQTSLSGDSDTQVWSVAIHPANPQVVLAGQTGWLDRDLYRSSDKGSTFVNQRVINSTGSIEDIKFDRVNIDVVYLAAADRGVFKSTDAGMTWKAISTGLPVTEPPYYKPVMCISLDERNNVLYAAFRASGATAGGISMSLDLGESWTDIDSALESFDRNASISDIYVDPQCPSIIYAAALSHGQFGTVSFSPGGVFRSTNRGATWQRIREKATSIISGDSISHGTIYASTRGGIISIVDTTALTDIEDCSSVPLNPELYQNYPNPFNQSTTISYYLPVQSQVTLKVYDILGREIKTLVTGEQFSGVRRVQWDGKNNEGGDVSSGIYFYSLRGRSYALTKKLVIVK